MAGDFEGKLKPKIVNFFVGEVDVVVEVVGENKVTDRWTTSNVRYMAGMDLMHIDRMRVDNLPDLQDGDLTQLRVNSRILASYRVNDLMGVDVLGASKYFGSRSFRLLEGISVKSTTAKARYE